MSLLNGYIAEALERIRASADPDLSWKDFSRVVGLDPSQVSKLRSGGRTITSDQVRHIVEAANAGALGALDASGIWKIFANVIAGADKRVTGSESFTTQGADYLEVIEKLIPTLSSGDTYTLITMEPPWELYAPQFAEKVTQAVRGGARFQYFVPASSSPEGSEWPDGFEDHISDVDGNALDMRISKWIDRISNRDPSLKAPIKSGNLRVIPVSRATGTFLFAPSIKYVLLTRKRESDHDDSLFGNSVQKNGNLTINAFAEISAVNSPSGEVQERTFSELSELTVELIFNWVEKQTGGDL